MKKLQNNFTTHEQSKRLLEVGVPADSADCYYLYGYGEKGYSYSEEPYIGFPETKEDIPCWSVGRLIELHELLFPGIKNFIIEKDDMSLTERMVRYFELCKEELDFSKLEDYE